MKRLYLILLLPLLLSCSVKEDRSTCPCWLDLELQGGAERRVEVSVWNGDLLHSASAQMEDGRAEEVLEVPRGQLLVSACSGVHACLRKAGQLLAREDGEMDEIYASAVLVDTRGDQVRTSLTLHKQFTRLHLGIVGTDSGLYPYRIELRGAVSGLSQSSLQPVSGQLRITLTPLIGTYHRLVLPRQRPEDPLELAFFRREDPSGSEPCARYPLGDRLLLAGFDWSAVDLEDIYLNVDYAEAGILVQFLDWEKELL